MSVGLVSSALIPLRGCVVEEVDMNSRLLDDTYTGDNSCSD